MGADWCLQAMRMALRGSSGGSDSAWDACACNRESGHSSLGVSACTGMLLHDAQPQGIVRWVKEMLEAVVVAYIDMLLHCAAGGIVGRVKEMLEPSVPSTTIVNDGSLFVAMGFW